MSCGEEEARGKKSETRTEGCEMKKLIVFFLLIATSAFAQTAKVANDNTAGQVTQESSGPALSGAKGQVPRESSGQVWQIPFASTGNTISLSIQNNSSVEAKNVSVTFNHLPTWLSFKSTTALLKDVSANSSGDAEFTFSVDKKAPVGIDTILRATISTADGQTWTKDITVEVAAPKDYKLYDNFPNPFNPSTKIAFELPKASHVKLMVHDIVGREVAQVADTDYPAGYSELIWNGQNKNGKLVSCGVYFYRLVVSGVEPVSTDRWSNVKKMLMIK